MEETMPLKPSRRPEQSPSAGFMSHLPESPRAPMEFLSRSWSASALQVSKTLAPPNNNNNNTSAVANHGICMTSSKSSNSSCTNASIAEDLAGENDDVPMLAANQFSFASSATSQLVLDRIMSQSMRDLEVSPLTSGRLSHSSGPLNGGSLTETDSPPISPDEEFDDVVKFLSSNNALQPLFNGGRASAGNFAAAAPAAGGGSKTVGRWLKDRKERKKEETRAQNAQIHAAVSVAAVASAIAAIAAATAASSAAAKNEQAAKTDAAVASAATLVAAQCAEAAESVGADRDHLAAVVSSAVNVRSYDDIITFTAAAATALRGVATLKARATKEVWNIAAVIPVEKGMGIGVCTGKANNQDQLGSGFSGELWAADSSAGFLNQDALARGTELLKRTRKGDLHWKIVSVYIHRTGQVMLKMKSKHVAGTITKKKKNVVFDVCKDVPAWAGRHLFNGGEQRRYFGLKTENRGLVEFECKNQSEYELWTRGVSRLLSIVAERRNRR